MTVYGVLDGSRLTDDVDRRIGGGIGTREFGPHAGPDQLVVVDQDQRDRLLGHLVVPFR